VSIGKLIAGAQEQSRGRVQLANLFQAYALVGLCADPAAGKNARLPHCRHHYFDE
jgi:hypothetical protein